MLRTATRSRGSAATSSASCSPHPATRRGARRWPTGSASALAAPFEVAGLHLHVAASVGIALFPDHADDAQELLRHADVAMYQAKDARSGHELYAADRDTHCRDRLALAAELPDAIAAGELELHFQPKADAASGAIVGVEALVRWRHPVRGLLPPDAFVPLAEHAGLMRELTRACHRPRWTHAATGARRATTCTSRSTSPSPTCSTPTSRTRSPPRSPLTAAPPSALIIEVTESSIMFDPVRIGAVLAGLGELGVGLSLDDFGTGLLVAHAPQDAAGQRGQDRPLVRRADEVRPRPTPRS